MAKSEQSILLDVTDELKLTQLGNDAFHILKQYGVHKHFRLSQDALRFTALEVVREVARRRRSWAGIDETLADVRGNTTHMYREQDQYLSRVSSLYGQAADVQSKNIKAKEVFAARDAAQRFSSAYWRYTPDVESHRGKLIQTSLRRAGEKYRPLGKVKLAIESRLPRRMQEYISNRSAA